MISKTRHSLACLILIIVNLEICRLESTGCIGVNMFEQEYLEQLINRYIWSETAYSWDIWVSWKIWKQIITDHYSVLSELSEKEAIVLPNEDALWENYWWQTCSCCSFKQFALLRASRAVHKQSKFFSFFPEKRLLQATKAKVSVRSHCQPCMILVPFPSGSAKERCYIWILNTFDVWLHVPIPFADWSVRKSKSTIRDVQEVKMDHDMNHNHKHMMHMFRLVFLRIWSWLLWTNTLPFQRWHFRLYCSPRAATVRALRLRCFKL